MLWLAVHFPQLSLDLFQAHLSASEEATSTTAKGREKEKKTQTPVVILEDNKVCLMNQAAYQCGIAPGCTLATAHSITGYLKFAHKDTHTEQKRLRLLAQTLYRFSGHVNILTHDCIVLEIGGSLKLFGDHTHLADAARSVCITLGHQVVTQVASTPKAALALARFKAVLDDCSDSCIQQQPSKLKPELENVPLNIAGLELCDIKADTVERFANMGIYTLGPLLKLPTKALGRRFGTKLLTFIGQLTGQLPDPLEPIAPVAHFEQTLHLLKPLGNKTQLYEHPLSPMRQLVAELQQWLITHQFGCEQIVWSFASGSRNNSAEKSHKQIDNHNELTHVPVKFAGSRQNPEDIMRISILKLDQVTLPDEVLSIGIRTYRLSAWHNQSLTLFPLTAMAATHQKDVIANLSASNAAREALVEEFNARLGEGSCFCISPINQHTPERAWQAQAQTRLEQNHQRDTAGIGPSQNQPTKRPLWLFDPPRPVDHTQLEILHGPERIQTQWWPIQAQEVSLTCRDYYIARHNGTGAECWAFVDTSTQWYLHGYFG
ncbi:MAG: DNA polymerase Y family protein [Pseudomonadota bacterium]